jgi:predicted metal-binding protein
VPENGGQGLTKSDFMHSDPTPYDALITLARSLGASAAVILPTEALVVEERFAAMCGAPHRCPSYGLAPGCPPNAPSPASFRAQLLTYRHVLVFKIDAPVANLMGPERLAIARTNSWHRRQG